MILSTIELTKRFGGLTALDSVNLVVEEKEIRAIIGPNGSGKTTMLNCLSGIYKPDGGSIVYSNTDITGSPPYKLTKIGIDGTFQNLRMFNSLTVLQNVMVACHCHTKASLFEDIFNAPRSKQEEKEMIQESEHWLEFMGLTEKRDYYPKSLSYGQCRMVEIARALASKPKLLLLDEPAAGLSQTEANRLADEIQKIRESGIAIILVEHNMRFIMNLSDKILVLNFGKVIADGTPYECRNNEKVVECYLGGTVNA
jgi:branched-chain amino acid transport system ATP-binding protein